MSPLVAALIGVLAGLLIGGAGMTAFLRRPVAARQVEAVASDEIAAAIGVLRAAVAILGPHDDLVVCNEPAERLGLVRGTRIGVPAVLDEIRAARQTGDEASFNVSQQTRAGRPSLQLAVNILPLGGGRILVVAEDRAPQLRAAEAGRTFLANATHELKTPIGAISLLSEAIQDASDDAAAVERFAGRIHGEAVRLTALVQQIITLSQLQERPALAQAERLEVDVLVADATARCSGLAEGHNVSLTTAGTRGLWVFGDAQQLTTALVNLIQNAINYSDDRARVVVTTRATELDDLPWVELAVSDNGIGIAPDDQARIFDRFYRVDYARSRETGGTGLGLTIVQEVAEGHGGSVTVWSRPGSGSTFTLRLPAATPQEEDA